MVCVCELRMVVSAVVLLEIIGKSSIANRWCCSADRADTPIPPHFRKEMIPKPPITHFGHAVTVLLVLSHGIVRI